MRTHGGQLAETGQCRSYHGRASHTTAHRNTPATSPVAMDGVDEYTLLRLTKAELVKACESLGVDSSGKKARGVANSCD